MQPIDAKKRLSSDTPPTVLDVREPREFNSVNIGGILIPLRELPDRLDELSVYRNSEILVVCRSGSRSALAVEFLKRVGFEKAINLDGGIIAWSVQVDPSMLTY